jgi:small subunit ribosomal protein S9
MATTQYTNTSGRRKCAVARVYLSEGTGNVTINGRDLQTYFPSLVLQYKVNQPFTITENIGKYDIKANIDGGGITGQAEALRLAISKALIEINPEWKSSLKAEGLTTRDPRMVERKKFGQKKARKRFQFSKR